MTQIAKIIDVQPKLTASAAIAWTITLQCEDNTVLKDVIPLTKKDRHRAYQLVDLLKTKGKTLHDQIICCLGKRVRFTENNGRITYDVT